MLLNKVFTRELGRNAKPRSAARFFHASSAVKTDELVKADVAILGGGVMGSAVAYFLKRMNPSKDFKVAVVERDMKYSMASTVLSVGGFRQQFSVKENIQMSMYSNEFIMNINEEFGITDEKDKIDLQIFEEGYMSLASTPEGAEVLKENHNLQQSFGAYTVLESPDQLHARYPWLNAEDILLGSVGTKLEGWLDPWSLLNAFRKQARELGVSYIPAEVVGFESDSEKVTSAIVKNPDDSATTKVSANTMINCCGCWSGYINDMMQQSLQNKRTLTPIPVVPKKRNVFVVKLAPEDAEKFDSVPLLFDPSGLWVRRDGRMKSNTFLIGKSPPKEADDSFFWSPSEGKLCPEEKYSDLGEQLFVDDDYFQDVLWEIVASRIPVFERCKVVSSWAGFYDYNLLDQNALIGRHLEMENVVVATGFSGHGIQQSPAVGRAVAEIVLSGKFDTLDLSRLSLERLITNLPVLEKNIY